MVMGLRQPGMKGVMPRTKIGVRNTVPSKMARMVPLGDFHISFRWYSSIRAALGVMVAHFTATPYFLVARAESTVTWSFVLSRFSRPRS